MKQYLLGIAGGVVFMLALIGTAILVGKGLYFILS